MFSYVSNHLVSFVRNPVQFLSIVSVSLVLGWFEAYTTRGFNRKCIRVLRFENPKVSLVWTIYRYPCWDDDWANCVQYSLTIGV